MEQPDANLLCVVEKGRKYSIEKPYMLDPDDIEKITVKPSTELIPDEYEHEDNGKGVVVIFYSKGDVENMKLLREALTDQNYAVPDCNVFDVSSKESVLNNLKEVAERSYEDKTCFILVFMGTTDRGRDDRFLTDDGDNAKNYIFIKELWSPFTSDNCPSLRYKPKTFILQACYEYDPIEYDACGMLRTESINGEYDIPAEADMLLVHKRVEHPLNRRDFILQLCNNINDDGHKDDIIGIVTHTDHEDEKRPLIISTLTRKFYVRGSSQRGHHHDLSQNHDAVTAILENLQEKIKDIQELQIALKRRIEQRAVRRWQEPSPAASLHIRQDEETVAQKRVSPPAEPSTSKKISRPPSSASSVDSTWKSKKTPKKPWRY